MSSVEGIRAAQAALQSVKPTLVVDGKWGNFTQQAFGAADPAAKLRVQKILGVYGLTTDQLRTERDSQRWASAAAAKTNNWQTVFDNEVVPRVLRVAQQHGFVKPELLVAQLRHESANGSRVSAPYNWAGMKPSRGQQAGPAVRTNEIIGGQRVTVSASFAAFQNANEFVDAYVSRLERLWPKTKAARTPEEYVRALNVGGTSMAYATERPEIYQAALTRQMTSLA